MKKTVDIVIPTYGQPEFTAKCFQSIAATSPPDQVRVIWIDNGSTGSLGLIEHSAYLLEVGGFSVERILLRENLGFVKATNVGIAVSTAPYVMLLNNDTELPEGWLTSMLAPFLNSSVGVVGPRSSAPTQWQSGVESRAGWSVEPTRTISFFCAMIRRAVVEKVGYLSEEFGVGFGDDDDYCTRARAAGFSVALAYDCTVVHHHRATFSAVYGATEWKRMLLANREIFYRKYNKISQQKMRLLRRRQVPPPPPPPPPPPSLNPSPAAVPQLSPRERRARRIARLRLQRRARP
jgi:GT2 family glycosyltransferase